MLAKGTPIQKSFIVPIFALQAPANIVSWIKYACQSHYLIFHYTTYSAWNRYVVFVINEILIDLALEPAFVYYYTYWYHDLQGRIWCLDCFFGSLDSSLFLYSWYTCTFFNILLN